MLSPGFLPNGELISVYSGPMISQPHQQLLRMPTLTPLEPGVSPSPEVIGGARNSGYVSGWLGRPSQLHSLANRRV